MHRKKKRPIRTILLFPFTCLYQLLLYLYIFCKYAKNSIQAILYKDNVSSMSGIEFEQYTKYLLEQNGYTNVELTKASNDYGIDILAMKGNFLYAIQCKKYTNKVGIDAIRQAATGCTYYDYDIAVVLTNSHFSSQAIKLAKTLEVDLWDAPVLESLMLHTKKSKRRKRLMYCLLGTAFIGISNWMFWSSFQPYLLLLFIMFIVLDILVITQIFKKK